eukprot:TRINITY_DN2543_c0_g1_i1.p1 TRINITY_DN2543_c0_g1~~TRINITY_DN2543_c0_g1_i1.p1  ORF type:complete len:191 (+),score=14.84 TRINITY_DN2543_c0_g1_i1:206-778(+)
MQLSHRQQLYGQPADERSIIDTNHGTSFVHSFAFKFAYCISITIAHVFIRALGPFFAPPDIRWTTVHLLHTAITFYLFHWVKGGEISHAVGVASHHTETFWEQIDDGVQHTRARKFLTIVPIVLFIITAAQTAHSVPLFLTNSVAFGIFTFLPKLPAMHKRRFLGMNDDSPLSPRAPPSPSASSWRPHNS